MEQVVEIFRTRKPILGMVHLGPLPGTPKSDRALGLKTVLQNAKDDFLALMEGGISAAIFCNEGDKPYLFKVGPEIVASMAYVVSEVTRGIDLPFGIDIQWDPMASIAVANAVQAGFVRGIFTGTYASDLGLFAPSAATLLRYRNDIGAGHVKLLFNLVPEFTSALGSRTLADTARSTVTSSSADVLCVSGYMAGTPTPIDDLRKVKQTVTATPVFANTGVRHETVAQVLQVADGCVVGTCFKQDGKPENRVSVHNVRRFMNIVREIKETDGIK